MTNYLLLVAMDVEFNALTTGHKISRRTIGKHLKVDLSEVEIPSGKVTVAKLGIGPVSAASVLTVIFEDSKYDEVVLLGLGGAIDKEIALGDIIIGTHVYQHDAICSSPASLDHMGTAQLPQFMLGDQEPILKIDCSKKLVEKFLKVFPKAHVGGVASGSEFVGTLERKMGIRNRFPSTLVVDMEACSVSYLCQSVGAELVIIKTASDALNESVENEFTDFIVELEKKCESLIKYL